MAWSLSPFSLQRVFSLRNRDVPVHDDELRLIRGFSFKDSGAFVRDLLLCFQIPHPIFIRQ